MEDVLGYRGERVVVTDRCSGMGEAVARWLHACPKGFERVFGLMTVFLLLTALAPFTAAKLHEASASYAIPGAGMAVFALINVAEPFLVGEKVPSSGLGRSGVFLVGGN